MERGSQQRAGGVLGADEVAAYRRDGFLVPRYRLRAAQLDKLVTLTARLVADNPGKTDEPMLGLHVPGSGSQRLKIPMGFADIATDPELLDLMEQLVGPDLILWSSVLFYKRAHEGPVTPWHRDATAYPIEPMATTSAWIAVTESRKTNGCLRFIPGSHLAGQVGRHDRTHKPGEYFAGGLEPGEYDESKAVDVELEPGQMVVFDVFTVHGGHANRGTIPRGGYSLRYMPGTSRYLHDAAQDREKVGYGHDTRALILVRGEDRTGCNDFRRGHPTAAT